MKNPVIVIPAYNPGEALITIVKEIVASIHQSKILIINDGSQSNDIFNRISSLSSENNITIINHEQNKGKGEALKTAFRYFIKNINDQFAGIVTVDADGQHQLPDILKIYNAFLQNNDKLIIGGRKFSGTVPLRSKIGNILTKYIFSIFTGKKLNDTQSGLRAIPSNMLQDLLLLEESAYDYELAMLIYANKHNFTIMDVPIATIYEDGNKSSHFRPIIDSIKIYFVFLRFSINSIFTAIVDYTVFALTYFISSNILASFILSRIFSCSFNFYFGKFSVFKSKKPARSEFIKYIGLVILHMLTTYYTVNIILNSYEINIIVAKAFVELSLFLISFLIQRLFIFKL